MSISYHFCILFHRVNTLRFVPLSEGTGFVSSFYIRNSDAGNVSCTSILENFWGSFSRACTWEWNGQEPLLRECSILQDGTKYFPKQSCRLTHPSAVGNSFSCSTSLSALIIIFLKSKLWLWNGLSLWSDFAFSWRLIRLKTFLFIYCSKISNLARWQR